MRFVSHSPGFKVVVVTEKVRFGPYGDRIDDRESYIAEFDKDITQADIEFAQRVFVAEGLLHGQKYEFDEVTPVPLRNRLSVFDTDERAVKENWEGRTITDNRGVEHDFKTYVEEFLSNRAEGDSNFRQVYVEPVTPPWPNYMQFAGTLEQLVAKVENDGYDLGRALEFERMANRPSVIKAYEDRIAELAAETAGAETVNA